jgi:hypothetical protein
VDIWEPVGELDVKIDSNEKAKLVLAARLYRIHYFVTSY